MKIVKSNKTNKTDNNKKLNKKNPKLNIKNQLECLNHTGCPTDGDNLDCGGVITH